MQKFVMLFFVSSSCAGGRSAGLVNAVHDLKGILAATARSAGASFASVGIGVDERLAGVALRGGPEDHTGRGVEGGVEREGAVPRRLGLSNGTIAVRRSLSRL
jgi:hypothetical protein